MRFYSAQCLSLLMATVATMPTVVHSLFAEDAGVLDFTIATTGHGVTNTAIEYEDSVVSSDTSSVSSTTTSCFVASRKVSDGTLKWRRNVCSNQDDDNQKHAMTVHGDYFYTTDNTGITRAWTMGDGNLVWDAQVQPPSMEPNLWTFTRSGKDYVAVSSDEELHILEAKTGNLFDTVGAQQKVKSGETAEWISVLPDNTDDDGDKPIRAIFAFVKDDGSTSSNRMFLVQFEMGDDQIKSSKALNNVAPATPILASSLKFQTVDGTMHAIAVTSDAKGVVHFSIDKPGLGKEISASSWNRQWSTISSIDTTSTSSLIVVQGSDANSNPSMSLFQYDSSNGIWGHVSVDSTLGAVAYCPEAEVIVGLTSASPQLYRWSGTAPLTMTGDLFVPDGDVVAAFNVLHCSSEAITALLSTARGTTNAFSFQISEDSATTKLLWTSEDGLASVSSAILLDASHLGVDDLVEEQDVVMQKLSLSSRISSQLQSVVSLFSGDMVDYRRRDHIFGFMKVAATVSQKAHRMWGVGTYGDERGSIRWSLDLPNEATWHSMVHGTANSVTSLHGINGGTHSREILVLSQLQSEIDWKCIDGTNGAINAQGVVDFPSPVLQVIPIYGSSGGCRQSSLLLHADFSMSVVPNDPETFELVRLQIQAPSNGFFAHVVDKATSTVQAFHVTESSGKFVATKIGRTVFTGEKVKKVAYPVRDEVVQSMAAILGDDSLLLKYINPHLATIITVLPEGGASSSMTPTELVSSIEKEGDKKQPRKPVGAGNDSGTSTGGEQPSVPNMFVNLIDTVSGRVIHRTSHYNVDPETNFAVVVSENWVLYTFLNAKSRRTELGVLTLHEGMIESKGLTMFTSPEQATEFSSLDARSSKPVVLAKTYTFPKMITALGTTATRGGISSRKILVASADGKLTSIDRAMLETRRPVGEAKEAEKKEGLYP